MSWLEGSPFPDYRIPRLFLLIVIGGGMLVSVMLAWSRSRLAGPAALAMGATLLGWLAIETVVIGFQAREQFVLLISTGVAGLVLALLGARSLRRRPDDG